MMLDDMDHLLLTAYLDGELPPIEALEIARRLEIEHGLRQRFDRLQELSGSVRRLVSAEAMPTSLRSTIAERHAKLEPLPRQSDRAQWRSLAAALLVGVLGGGGFVYGILHMEEPSPVDRLADEIYSVHLRSLMAPQPFDIASSDRHVVKPWFNGRTAIAPEAPDLAAEGFPLAGGRVDVIAGEPVPALVYRRRQHVISVTMIPKRPDMEATEVHREGSTIERWSSGDLSYLAVSDLNVKELDAFIELFKARIAPSP